jgi:putative FmdB family regulatory protein
VPIYEYEPDDRECFICNGRVEAIQNINDEPLKYCPTCGLEVRKVISKATFKIGLQSSPEKAAEKGFTTYKRAEKGKWEKVGGHGPDMIVGSKEDMQAVEDEKKPPKKVVDLDNQ